MKRLFSDAVWTAVANLVGALCALAVQVFLVRHFAPDVFGGIVVALAGATLIEAVVVSRSSDVAMYWVGRTWKSDPSKARAFARYLVGAEWKWGAIAYAGLMVAALALEDLLRFDGVLMAAFGGAILLRSGYGVSKTVLIAAGKLRELALQNVACSTVYLVTVLVLTMSLGTMGLVAAMLSTAAYQTYAAQRLSKRYWPAGTDRSLKMAPPAGGASWHSLVRNTCTNIVTHADVLILGMRTTNESVAYYKAARTLASIPARIAWPVWFVLRPSLLTALSEADYRRVRRLIVIPAIVFALIGVACLPLVVAYATAAISMIYGPAYESITTSFFILLVGNWWFGAITGWFAFIAVIATRRATSTALFVALALTTLIGAGVAGNSEVGMATVVSGALLLVGMAAWLVMFHSGKLVPSSLK